MYCISCDMDNYVAIFNTMMFSIFKLDMHRAKLFLIYSLEGINSCTLNFVCGLNYNP